MRFRMIISVISEFGNFFLFISVSAFSWRLAHMSTLFSLIFYCLKRKLVLFRKLTLFCIIATAPYQFYKPVSIFCWFLLQLSLIASDYVIGSCKCRKCSVTSIWRNRKVKATQNYPLIGFDFSCNLTY